MVKKSSGLLISALLCAGFACGIASAQQVTISRDTNIHSEPKADASVVGQLTKGASAEVTGKQGAWVQVKSGSGTGWVYSFNVSYGSGGPAAAGAAAQRRAATTPTIGIRGLEEEDLKAAKFDGKQLDALDQFAGDAEPAGGGPAPKGRKK